MPTPQSFVSLLLFRTGVIASALLPLARVEAQLAPAPSPATATENLPAAKTSDVKPVELSPFQVQTDRDLGYAASNTQAGSRLNTELKDIAAPISVFNRDFLDDIGKIDVNEALEYAVNATTDFEATGNNHTGNNFNTRIRGIGNAGRTRNFFATGLNIDFYNTERLDFSRGPNAVLFGAGSPAGLITTSTKFAVFDRDFTQLQARVASYGGHRGSLDFNKTFGKTLALRANLLAEEADGYWDFEFVKKKGASLAGTWRPFKNTQVRFEGETFDRAENRARPWTPYDGFSAWEVAGRLSAGSPTTWGNAVAGSGNAGANSIITMTSGPWAGQTIFTTGTQLFRTSAGPANLPGLNTPPNILDPILVPRTANFAGAGPRIDSYAKVGSIYIEHKITEDLRFELAAGGEFEKLNTVGYVNFGQNRIIYDVNAYLPTFDDAGVQTAIVPNPNFGRMIQIAGGASGGNSHIFGKTYRMEGRATALYTLDFEKLLKSRELLPRLLGQHRLSALYLDNHRDGDIRRQRQVNVHPTRINPNYFNANNVIVHGSYIDPYSENEANRGFVDPQLHPVQPQTLKNRPGVSVQPSMETASWTWSKATTATKMFAMQNYFWDDRLVTLFGWRTDEQKLFGSTEVFDPVTTARTGFIRDTAPRVVTGDTFTRGVVFHVLPRYLSLYYNRANSFNDNGVAQVFGIDDGKLTSIGNVVGRGEDAGVKVRMFGGKLNAQAGWYRTEDTNKSTATDGNFAIFARELWEALGQTVTIGGRDIRSDESKGYEFELTYNPIRQVRLTANVKNATTTVSEFGRWLGEYLDSSRATWLGPNNQNANLPMVSPPGGVAATIGAVVAQYEDLLRVVRAQIGRDPFQDRRTTANFFGHYTFAPTGPLKGLAGGLGLQYRGKSLIAYRIETDNQAVLAPAFTDVNGMVSYVYRLSKQRSVRFQLNVDNLTNNIDPQPIAGGQPVPGSAAEAAYRARGYISADGVAEVVRLPIPRRYSLSATIDF